MKLNLFKVEKENAMDLVVDLEDSGYEMEANHEDEHGCVMLYLKKNHSENQGWLVYYKIYWAKIYLITSQKIWEVNRYPAHSSLRRMNTPMLLPMDKHILWFVSIVIKILV